MEQLIPVINKLQDVFNAVSTDPIDLPQIVVVGSQSSGKSSVLENIVGRDFLPRGSGIVTRRPLVLQLINLPWDGPKSEESFAEWGEFLHKPNEMFYEFSGIRDEIIKETERITGKNKGISSAAIHLKIYSPHVLNLTLVDLPGITKVPVGDQPSDIEMQIRKMIHRYIEKPNSVILAVTPANSDIANSDALQLAREVDPEGLRTIGVLTKVDIMDKGTDCMDVLLGKMYPLKLGFIPVINRSQHDIISDKPIREALKHESDFFANHPIYRTIAVKTGTGFLAKNLNRILMTHIRDCLPDLKVRINKLLLDAQTEFNSYGDPLYDAGHSKGALLLQILTRFASDYRDAIDGKLTDYSISELYGGARINFIFNEVYSRCLDSINPKDGLTLNDIRTAIRNATGPRSALFVPEVAFELLVRRQISVLEEPALQCVELVFDELQRIITQLENKDLLRFSNLRERVVEVTHGLLQRARKPTREMINNLMALETSYMNTNHPDFLGGTNSVEMILEKLRDQRSATTIPVGWIPVGGSSPSNASSLGNKNPQQAGNAPATGTPPYLAPPGGNNANNIPPNSSSPQSVPHHGKQKDGFLSSFFTSSSSGGGNYSQQSQQHQQQQQPKSLSSGQPAPQSYNKQNSGDIFARSDRLEQVPNSIRSLSAPSDKERIETELIQTLLISYFDIVRKNFKDMVPKAIMCFLVNSSKNHIQNELVTSLYKDEYFESLLEESPAIANKRAECKSRLDVLRQAYEILNEVRDYNLPR